MTNCRPIRTLAGVLLLAATRVAPAPAQDCPGPVASYHVRVAGDGLFGVEATFHIPTRHLQVRFSEAIGRPEAQAASVLRSYVTPDVALALGLVPPERGRPRLPPPPSPTLDSVLAAFDAEMEALDRRFGGLGSTKPPVMVIND